MELLDTLNQRLSDHFGRDETGRAIFRIVWSDDQLEKRLTSETDAGIQLLEPVVREVKKYPYIQHRYLLERLVVIPDFQQRELPVSRLSYEPLWTFQNNAGEALPPIWNAAKFIIDTLYAAMGKKSLRRYVDDEKNTTQWGRDQRIKDLQAELFGNETETADALRYKEGIVVPSNYKGAE